MVRSSTPDAERERVDTPVVTETVTSFVVLEAVMVSGDALPRIV